ncbi:MAG: 16S rRNA (cytidine(1402)-2'-O)-methyltransferase [Oscillospiraceae bacterium]|jgi:16S rRNA (cytidine1402-2'-O)-methyltransferase|nr:16S rRNA (cytidine(1402)-2'-O)-methyltransferase [Oscillospiraceae bacterium]
MSGTLFVVGTPIGNLGDFSPRAADALSSCDFIAAEDTRVTIKLLNHFNIKKPMVSYHEHNRFDKADEIVARIRAGESCTLVTDAGMPAISDPGTELVRACHNEGIPVMSVPGPSAIITAAAISGLDVSRFSFEGFLSVNKQQRRAHLEEIKTEKKTMIFYEAPHKLPATLADLHGALGDRTCAVIKELTKIYETVRLTTLAAAAKHYAANKPRGEFVIIIEPAPQQEAKEQTFGDAVRLARELQAGGLPQNEAAKQAAKQTGFKKSDIYRELLCIPKT